jgi:hypothetical protein
MKGENMYKKSLKLITFLCAMIPMAAYASTWSLATRVTTVGGNVAIRGAQQTSVQGTVFKTYTTHATITPVITADLGYKIASVSINGLPQTLPVGATALDFGQHAGDPYALKVSQALVVSFVKNASANVNIVVGSTSGGGIAPLPGTYVVQAGSDAVLTVTPLPGYKLTAINGVATFKSLKDANTGTTVSLPYAGAVRATFTVAAAMNVSATFVADTAVSAGANATGIAGTAVNLAGTVSGAGPYQYSWVQTNGPVTNLTGAATATPSFTPAVSGVYVFTLTASNSLGTSIASVKITVADLGGSKAAATAYNQCVVCHNSAGVGVVGSANVIYNNWSASAAKKVSGLICTDCHSGANNGAHPGVLVAPVASHDRHGFTCDKCHGDSINGDAHASQAQCIKCHSVGVNANTPIAPALVNDNNGVRAITTEFGKWSHHVTGVNLNDAHCAACHLEGKVVGSTVVIDKTKHMADATVHLRNADDDTDMVWDPATPNHTTMDNFCMSCHDANGATSAASVQIQAFINTLPTAVVAPATSPGRVGTASPLNPFGDTISNQYDQLSRGAVVAVSEQFDAGNTSHHGVSAQRYTSKNLTTAQFSNISTANFAAGIKGVSKNANPALAGIGTIYENGRMTDYVPFGGTGVLADNSRIHCADCHTVGQWKPNTTKYVNADGSLGANVATVIGAHGSNNEYMLRNAAGTDVTKDANRLPLTSNTGANAGGMVCTICHKGSVYVNNSGTGHAGEEADSTNCNGPRQNTAGAVALDRLGNSDTSGQTITANASIGLIATGKYGTSGAGNIFGMSCANCHNSSDGKLFGGIHGNAARTATTTTVVKNVGYTSYSGATSGNTTAGYLNPDPLVKVARKPYRFLPGLGNFRFNGGVNSDAWTRQSMASVTSSERMGCYTLNGSSSKRDASYNGGAGIIIDSPSPTKAVNAGTNVSAKAIADDNGILGSWGGCAHHSGSSVSKATGAARKTLRPLTY